jgi:membrane-bound ClpP family serine protease
LSLFGLPKGLAFIALVLALLALTAFFLIDDVLYYLLIERMFDLQLNAISKMIVAAIFLFLNFGVAVLVVRAMLRRPETGSEAMVGAQCEVIESIQPVRNGWVRIHGELWRAAAEESIGKGKIVEVAAVEGLLLRVRMRK